MKRVSKSSAKKVSKKASIKKVLGYVKQTESNWRMQPLFEKRGFQKVFENNKIRRYEFNLFNDIIDYPDWLKVVIK